MPPDAALGAAGTVVVRRTARAAARSGLVWGLVFAVYIVNSSYTYATTYPDAAARAKVARSFTGNSAFNALLGTARRLDTVPGFTNWKILAFLTVLGAAWGVLLATRLTRGEEDAGRWELVLAGPTTRQGAAAQAAAGVGAGLVTLWAVTAIAAVAIGSTPRVGFTTGEALFLATALVGGAATFTGLGLLTAQLAANRRQANAVGAAILGAAYLLRMVADSSAGLGWLRWATPLGWVENLRPLVGSDPTPFVPITLTVGLTVGAAVVVAGRRDLNSSVLPSRDTHPPHTRVLSGPTGLALRLGRNVDAAWVAAVAVLGLVLGLVAQSAASAVNASPSFEQAVRRLGGRRGGAASYLGVAFLIAAALVAFIAAGQVSSTRDEESEGRVDHLLVRPVARWRWLGSRLAVATALLAVAGVATGCAGWVGAATQHSGVGFAELANAGVNIVPPALFVLGFGTAVYGVLPRRASIVVHALVVWSLVVELIGSLVRGNRLLINTSVLAHMTPAPAANPDWTAAAWLTGLGALAAAVGVLAFSRRDLVGP